MACAGFAGRPDAALAAPDDGGRSARPQPRRRRLQTFLGRPAIVAAVAVTAPSEQPRPDAEAPRRPERQIHRRGGSRPKLHHDSSCATCIGSTTRPPHRRICLRRSPAGDGQSDRAIRLDAEAARAPKSFIVSFPSSRWRSPDLRCWQAWSSATCAAPLRPSRRAKQGCAISRCTIRSAGCRTATFSASGWKLSSRRCARAARTAAVLYIDLDHFKDVNDTLGHPIGDELILAVSRSGSPHACAATTWSRASAATNLPSLPPRRPDHPALQAIANAHDRHPLRALYHRQPDHRDRRQYRDRGDPRARQSAPPTSCATPTWRSIAPRTRAATAPASTTRRWMPICSNASSWRTICARRSRMTDCRLAYQPIVNNSGEQIVGVEALCRWTHPDAGRYPAGRVHPDRRA